jgi:hypothetical protein
MESPFVLQQISSKSITFFFAVENHIGELSKGDEHT